ncbi:MAG TPA: hypothetical protein VGG03_07870 [Thermoanaerobaculia bacterium]
MAVRSKKDEAASEAAPAATSGGTAPVSEAPPPAPEPVVEQSPAEALSATLEGISARVLKQADLARKQVEANLVDHGLLQLQQAVEQLQTLARVATGPAAPLGAPAREIGTPGRDCGCGCGEKPRSCCIQLYISRVRVVESQGLLEGDLELIFAVRALDQCGLLPSLSSYMSIAQFGGGWAPAFAPIGKFCVPCNGVLVVPLIAEALETGGAFEGKPERGSAHGAIALRCNCDVVPVILPITLGGTLGSAVNPKKGKVEVEISGRPVEGGCCC